LKARSRRSSHAATRRIDTGHGVLALEVSKTECRRAGVSGPKAGRLFRAHAVSIETERPDGARQRFAFAGRGDYLESIKEIPEPH